MVTRWAAGLFGLGVVLGVTACGGVDTDGPETPPIAVVDPNAPAPGSAQPPPALPSIARDPNARPLTVVAAFPRGSVEGAIQPVVTFERPVVALGTLDETPAPPITLTPAVRGRWRWMGSSAAEFVPEQRWPFSTRFEVKIAAGVVALDGGALAEPYAYTFETPTIEPQWGDPASPGGSYAWARADQKFEVTFSQRPVERSLVDKVVIEAVGQPPVAPIPLKVLLTETTHEKAVREAKARGETPPEAPTFSGADGVDTAGDHRVVVQLQPTGPLALDREYQLVFRPGLESAEGPLTLARELRWNFKTYGALGVGFAGCHRWGNGCPTGPLSLEFSNPVKASALKAALTLEPAVKLQWPEGPGLESASSSHWLDGNFKPETTYTVRLSTGLTDEFGQTLKAPFEGTFRTGSFGPEFMVRGDRALLERGLRASLPVTHVNVPALDVRIARLDETTVLPWLENPWRSDRSITFTDSTLQTTAERNAWRRSPLDLAETFTGPGQGRFALVELGYGTGKERRREMVVVQVTDLAVHYKVGPTRSEVFVWSLSSGKGVAGAQVELVDLDGRRLAEARSDDTGIAALPGVGELALPQTSPDGYPLWGPPFLAARVRLGDDVAVTSTADAGWSMGAWRFDLREAWEGTPPVAEGLVFADRGIYRPGEVVYAKGFLRERSLGKLRTPTGRAINVELVNPQGEVLATQPRNLSAFGGFDVKFDLPATGQLGEYGVRVTDPGTKLQWHTSVRMAEYRAPEFQVQVHAHDASKFSGDPVKGVVEGRYLFGSAMREARVEWALTASPGFFSPENPEGYVYGRRQNWWESSLSDDSGRLVASGVGQLDAKGELLVEAGKALAEGDRPQRYTLEATVTDVNRQTVSGRKGFDIHPAAHYVGLLAPSGFATAGKPFEVQVVSVDAIKKTRTAGAVVTVKLKRHEWNTVQKQTVGGTFETVSESQLVDVSTCAITTAAKPMPCAFTTEKPGFHELVAESADAQGRKTTTNDGVWVGGEGYAAWLQDDDDRVEVVADRAIYDVGDEATLLVQSPFPEAEAWVTVEREGVLSHQRLRLKGTATPLKIKIDESMIPNVFVGVVLARGRVTPPAKSERGNDAGRPAFKVGYRELRIVPTEKRLTVKLQPDAPEKRPGSDLSIDVAVTDRRGKGAKAEVAVWAVDEGVLSLTGYVAPDPIDTLFQPRGLSVRQGTNVAHLVPQFTYGEKGKETGGGGGLGVSAEELRSRFVTTPIFVGNAITGEDGRTRVQGKLPDNLTTFRLMAVAVTDQDRGGKGESKVIVNKPLMARPALPRAARVGDKFAAGVVIHSKGEAKVEVDVEATIVSGGVKLLDKGPRRIALEPDRGREVRFAFQAEQPGPVKLRFVVRARGDKGASDAVELEVPVTRPTSVESVAVYGETSKQVTEGLKVPGPAAVVAGEGGLSLSLSSSALAGLADNARQLVDYPYGCLEQQSSRLMPLVALKDMLETHGKAWVGDRDPRAVVSKAVADISAMEAGGGGFGYWPGATCAHYFGTAYATLALGEALRAGYQVDTGLLERSRAFLVQHYDSPSACEWFGQRSDEERALALHVLARQDAPQREWARQLYERRAKLALFGRALLAQALARAGTAADTDLAKTLVTELMNNARVDAGSVHFQESDPETYAPLFSTDVRTTAMVLQALMVTEPQHTFAAQIARFLVGARENGQYATTQEAAFALMALHDYSRVREASPPSFTGGVELAGTRLFEAKFEGRSLDAQTGLVDWAKLRTAATPAPLVFSVNGTGSLYYGARLTYVPTTLQTEATDQGLVVQRWYEPLGQQGAGQVRAVSEGEPVRVRVRLATTRMRHYVVLEDPLPSGLEAVDTTLATAGRQVQGRAAVEEGEGEGESEALDGADAWYSVFNRVEMRDDRVLLFADHLPPGVHSYTYVARATTPGTFVLKPARAEAMYAPEIFGRSDGGTFWVHPRAEVSAR